LAQGNFFLKILNRPSGKNLVSPCGPAYSLRLNARVQRFLVLAVLCGSILTLGTSILHAEGLQESTKKFVYRDSSGRVTSVKIIHHYWSKPIVHPFAKIDPRLTENAP